MKHRTTVLLKSLILFTTILLFISCKNFFEGSEEAKSQIQRKIYINNHECPVATVEEPAYSDAGVEKNTAIVISFTLPVDPQTFKDSYQIVDATGKSLLEYFTEPQWAADNKSVIIAANEQNLIDLGADKTKDIYFKLSKDCQTADKLPIKQTINHKYRINNSYDNVPPTIDLVRATLPAAYINKTAQADEEPLLLVEGAITKDSEEEICKTNHINTKFDLYIEGSDYGGGRVWGLLRYRRLYDAVGNAVQDEEEEKLITFEEHTADGKWYGTANLDISDNSKYLDGLYQVKVSVKDSYGLEEETPKIYNIIRDTTLAYSMNGRMNLLSFQYRDINEIPEGFDPSINNLEWNDPKRVLPDITYNGQLFSGEVYNGWNTMDFYKGNSISPTAKFIETWRQWLEFAEIINDVYYVSPLTGTSYSNPFNDFSYYLAWGTDNLTDPVKLEWDENYKQGSWSPEKAYKLPDACLTYCAQHEADDIYFEVTYVDTVGNKNKMTLVYPRIVDFYNYVVEDDDVNGNSKKKVTLNFSDMSQQQMGNFLNLSDKSVRVLYRIFYGKYEVGDDPSLIELTRNPAKPWIYDPFGNTSDSKIIYNLEPNKKYVVYIQSDYETDSLINSQYTGGIQGPMRKVIINTGLAGGTALVKPEFTWTKATAGINTGLFDVTATVSNFNENVKYIPAYSMDDGENWIYYESESKNTFTFTVKNPLRMPIKAGEAWANSVWDYTFRTSNWGGVETDADGKKSGGWEDDNTYFLAVKNCKAQCGGYPDVIAKVKILAVTDDEIIESDIQDITFTEDDDNIPPYVSNDIILHDSKLSYDGHSFMFNELIREDEGHILEYFDYYYVPYQEMWGNNLNVLSEAEIASLPGGVSSFDSSCWIEKNPKNANYHLNISIPTFGLADGKYLYFAKLSDSYGNYRYVTLGQAHIGTFKNKLTVEYDSKNNRFISRLPIEADETFDRYMISIQCLGYDNRTEKYIWQEALGWSNELQDCQKKVIDGKTVLENTSGVGGQYGDWIGSDIYGKVTPEPLYAYNYYRITVQAFNNNSYNDATGKGADREYGRPYCDVDADNIWDHDVKGYVPNESEYDVCTDETVSNTVVMYIPPDPQKPESKYWYDEPVQSSFFVDTATPRSNKDYFVQIIASSRDLGNDIDEWERRGKIVKTYQYNTGVYESGKYIINTAYDSSQPETVDNPKYILNPAYLGYDVYIANPDYNTFDASVALEDMYNSREKGLVYYVVVAYFADNSRSMSQVYTMQGF